jgi:hypothetical protein
MYCADRGVLSTLRDYVVYFGYIQVSALKGGSQGLCLRNHKIHPIGSDLCPLSRLGYGSGRPQAAHP